MKYLNGRKLFFLLGIICGFIVICTLFVLYRSYRRNEIRNTWRPNDTSVQLDSTNLPIIIIDSRRPYGGRFSRDKYIKAHMTIVSNSSGVMNYADTLAHPNQHYDYDGEIQIRFRGHSSYLECRKKSFSIRPIGKKSKPQKKSLLGMRKDKKWALRAVQRDKTLMHDKLVTELSRRYFDYVAEMEYCEVIINGIYVGVYLLSEQITHNRLGITTPGREGDSLTGGYLFQIDRPLENRYFSKYYSRKNNGEEITRWKPAFEFEGISFNEMTNEQRSYICDRIDLWEKALATGSYDEYSQFMDVMSFIDYLLITEFAHNADGYCASDYIYKNVDSKDSLFYTTIWDFDAAFGSGLDMDFYGVNTWQYNINDAILRSPRANNPRELKCIPFWWQIMINDKTVNEMIVNRWKQYRQEVFSTNNIYHIIDSLTLQLHSCGAEERNAQAWSTYTEMPWRMQRFLSTNHFEEIEYLKLWIECRLAFMDEQLLMIQPPKEHMDSVCQRLGQLLWEH